MNHQPAKRFQRTKENFVCMNCAASVQGNGYTNHCPVCLWSRHVDVNPGDRAAECKGGMPPVGVERRGGDWIILHRCERCGFKRKQRSNKDDSMDMLIQISHTT